MDEHRYADACMKFAASERFEPGLGTSLWLADCLQNNGQTASAWEEFERAVAVAARTNDSRELVARTRAEKLLPELSRVVVTFSAKPDEDVQIDCDGAPVPRVRWAEGFYVDPGTHHLRATLRGSVFWEADVSVGPRADVERVVVALPRALEGVPQGTPEPVARPLLPSPSPAAFSGSAPSHAGAVERLAGVASMGLGVVAVGAGTGLAVVAKRDNDDASGCGSQFCTQQAHDLRQTAHDDATFATVALAIGAGAIVGGALLYILSTRASRTVGLGMGPTGSALSGTIYRF